MVQWVYDVTYTGVQFLARGVSKSRRIEFRARWALRYAAWTSDDDYLFELFHLTQPSPHILEALEAEISGEGWIATKKRKIIRATRDAFKRGIVDPY